MRPLWLQLTAAIAGGIFLSITLLVLVIFVDNARSISQLDPAFAELFADALAAGNLEDPQTAEELRQRTIHYVSDSEGFGEIIAVLARTLTGQTRLIVLAAVFALPFGMLAAFLIARVQSRPVTAVSQAAQRVAAGDLGARAALPRRIAPASEMGMLVSDFNKMADALEQLEHERQDMIADVAHELRTPLTIIQGQVDAMQYGVVPLDADNLAKVGRHIELLGRLVKDLRTLSLADARRLTLDRRPTSLPQLTGDIVEGFQDQAQAQGITLELEDLTGGSLTLQLDGDRVAQVLINLLSNALRHTPEGGRVQVTLTAGDSTAVLAVQDEGEGLGAEELEGVFRRFYRTDSGRSRAMGGTGLGLAISRAIAELHGGSLNITSARGRGTRLTLTLPLQA